VAYYDDVTVTSLINIRHSSVAVASIPKEQHSVIRFLWAQGLSVNAIQSDMCPVYGDKYFTRPAIGPKCSV